VKGRLRTVKRSVFGVVMGLYLVTWVWGIPAVHTSIAADMISLYKKHAQRNPGVVRNRAVASATALHILICGSALRDCYSLRARDCATTGVGWLYSRPLVFSLDTRQCFAEPNGSRKLNYKVTLRGRRR